MDGKRLKEYILGKGMKIGEVAEKMQVSKQTMTTWLKTGAYNEAQRKLFIEKLSLPENFFDAYTEPPSLPYADDTYMEKYLKSMEEKEELFREIMRLQREKEELHKELEHCRRMLVNAD